MLAEVEQVEGQRPDETPVRKGVHDHPLVVLVKQCKRLEALGHRGVMTEMSFAQIRFLVGMEAERETREAKSRLHDMALANRAAQQDQENWQNFLAALGA